MSWLLGEFIRKLNIIEPTFGAVKKYNRIVKGRELGKHKRNIVVAIKYKKIKFYYKVLFCCG